MSHASDPEPPPEPAPKIPAPPARGDPQDFGAGAFEASAPREEVHGERDPAPEIALESAAPFAPAELALAMEAVAPVVIELGPSTPPTVYTPEVHVEPMASAEVHVVEEAPELVEVPAPELSMRDAEPSMPVIEPSAPPVAPSVSATPATPPPVVAMPALEPPPAPARRVTHEVEAVPVGRFEAPAPTIDVQARRAPPPEPPPARARPAPSAPPPPVAETAFASAAPPTSASDGASAHAAASSTTGDAKPPLARTSDATSRWWSAFCHLFLFLDLVTFFLGSVITLLVWQLAGKNDPLLDDQGREALNFQLNVAIVTALLALSCLGSPLIPVVWLLAVIFCILGATRAANGESYRYPFIFRLVRA